MAGRVPGSIHSYERLNNGQAPLVFADLTLIAIILCVLCRLKLVTSIRGNLTSKQDS